jgi:hypothetical protein
VLIVIAVLYGLAFVTSRFLTRLGAGGARGAGMQATVGVR